MSVQQFGSGPGSFDLMAESYPQGLHNLQIKTTNPDQLLDPADIRFSIVAAAVHYALVILEEKGGRAALTKLGRKIGKDLVLKHNPEYQNPGHHPLLRDMTTLVNYYLVKLRRGFLNLAIQDFPDDYARYQHPKFRTPGKDYKYLDSGTFDPNQYDPKDCGTLYIDDSKLGVCIMNPAASPYLSRRGHS
jgi:hypothetical protein